MSTLAWTYIPSNGVKRTDGTAFFPAAWFPVPKRLSDGRHFIFSGYPDNDNSPTANHLIYWDEVARAWKMEKEGGGPPFVPSGSFPAPNDNGWSCIDNVNGEMWIGGGNSYNFPAKLGIYNFGSKTWRAPTSAPAFLATVYNLGVTSNERYMVLYGGTNYSTPPTSGTTLFVFDGQTQTWTQASSQLPGVADHNQCQFDWSPSLRKFIHYFNGRVHTLTEGPPWTWALLSTTGSIPPIGSACGARVISGVLSDDYLVVFGRNQSNVWTLNLTTLVWTQLSVAIGTLPATSSGTPQDRANAAFWTQGGNIYAWCGAQMPPPAEYYTTWTIQTVPNLLSGPTTQTVNVPSGVSGLSLVFKDASGNVVP